MSSSSHAYYHKYTHGFINTVLNNHVCAYTVCVYNMNMAPSIFPLIISHQYVNHSPRACHWDTMELWVMQSRLLLVINARWNLFADFEFIKKKAVEHAIALGLLYGAMQY